MADYGLTKNLGQRTKKGTLITKDIQSQAKAINENVLEIREDNTEIILGALDDAVIAALEKIGLACEGYAKRLCPVDTGRLRNSITHALAPDEDAVYVGTNVEYGPTVELGAKNTKYKGANDGRGFLRPAATDHKSEYERILKAELS